MNNGAEKISSSGSALLKFKPKRCLQIPWGTNDRCDRANLCRSDSGIWIAELWMVEDVERLKSELELHLFVDWEGLEY
jgi:hypothetical protein